MRLEPPPLRRFVEKNPTGFFSTALAITVTNDPVNTKTTVSEILLPSYERMAETYVLKVA